MLEGLPGVRWSPPIAYGQTEGSKHTASVMGTAQHELCVRRHALDTTYRGGAMPWRAGRE
jgi:hypothetical protein